MFTHHIKSLPNEDISILVKLDNHSWNYLCECGDASLLTVKEIQNCNAIFISHTHIDHFVNFDAVIRHQIGIQRSVVICGPKNIAQQIQARLQSYTWNLIEENAITYEIRELTSTNTITKYELKPPFWQLEQLSTEASNLLFKTKAFEVSGILLDHKTPTLAYRFKENNTVKIDIQSSGFKGGKWVKELKDAFTSNTNPTITIESQSYQAKELFHLLQVQEGDSLGIIMDHAAHSENHLKIKNHFYHCNQVLIESFYKNEDKEFAEINFHSYAKKSAEIMRLSKVKQATPVHFSRKYQETDILEIIQQFNNEFKTS